MDEEKYRETYQKVNVLPCVFERAILRRCGTCESTQHLNIAEREAIGCLSESSHKDCKEFLVVIHEKSAFAIVKQNLAEKLPFSKEIKIQCGSILWLKSVSDADNADSEIHTLIQSAITASGGINNLPFEHIVRDISSFESRRKRHSRR